MLLLLLRHPESLKNVHNQFSSDTDDELLTSKGMEECLRISEGIRSIISDMNLSCKSIYCANSIRSIETAKVIARALDVSITIEEALRSTKPGVLAGQTEAEARKSNPLFIAQLDLYRAGLFNSYDFNVAQNKEPKRSFEKRVLDCLDKILLDETETIKVVIAHRASLTGILINFARQYYNYPTNFYGYVKLDLGKASVLYRAKEDWAIKYVNIDINEIEI